MFRNIIWDIIYAHVCYHILLKNLTTHILVIKTDRLHNYFTMQKLYFVQTAHLYRCKAPLNIDCIKKMFHKYCIFYFIIIIYLVTSFVTNNDKHRSMLCGDTILYQHTYPIVNLLPHDNAENIQQHKQHITGDSE